MPASQELKALAKRGNSQVAAGERRERLILLTLINHPGLLYDFADDITNCEFLSSELDSLRKEILDIAALDEGLEKDTLRDHLIKRGSQPVLDRLNTFFLIPLKENLKTQSNHHENS